MQFELLRLSMAERIQRDAFERRAADGAQFTRETWLRDIFGQDVEFPHRGDQFHFSPHEAPDPSSIFILGRIGRKVTVVENEPPEGHLAPKEHEAWRAALVMIDPTPHDDGQKLAVEHQPTVGRPVPLLESFVAKVNSRSDEPFILEANAIVPTEAFWDFVEKNQGEITSIQFEFVTPNMFGEADDYDQEMRNIQQMEKAQKAKLELESRDGLNLSTPRIKRAVDYTIKGAGSIKARTKKKRRYNSKDKAQRVSVANTDISDMDTPGLFSRLFSAIFGQ